MIRLHFINNVKQHVFYEVYSLVGQLPRYIQDVRCFVYCITDLTIRVGANKSQQSEIIAFTLRMEVKAMRKTTRILGITLLLAATLLTFVRSDNFAGSKASTQKEFPPGRWGFSAHPYMGEGYESRPVVVTSVKTELKDLSVTAVRVRNISSKSVVAVKFGWYLLNESDRRFVLQEGASQVISMEDGLVVGEGKTLQLPIVSFGQVSKTLIRGGRLEGDYRLEIAVTEILFEDLSTWTIGQKVAVQKQASNTLIVKASFRVGTVPLTVTPIKAAPICPKQKCKLVEGPPDGYTCVSSEFEEYCTNCITSCCNTVCSDPTPACGSCA